MDTFHFVNTLDFDLLDHVRDDGRSDLGEMDFLLEQPGFFHPKDTLFLRVDEAALGAPGYAARLERALTLGLPVGAHIHACRPGTQEPETDEEAVGREIEAVARRFGSLTACRMGWGYMSNGIMRELSGHYRIDSSAIPRPRLPFDKVRKDWEGAPSVPYHPARADYRRTGADSLPILEVPMSTAPLRAPYDTMPVIRYLNLAFRPEFLRPALRDWIRSRDLLVCITHPAEFLLRKEHALIAYDRQTYRDNLDFVASCAAVCGKTPVRLTLDELADLHAPGH